MSSFTSSTNNSSDNKNDEESKESFKIPALKDIPWSSLLSITSSKPQDVISGVFGGIESAIMYSLATLAFVVVAPIQATLKGYEYNGILGGVSGFGIGSLVGILGGSVVAIAGCVSLVQQVGVGVYRTPGTILGRLTGKDWDEDAAEWILYNLVEDADKTLNMSVEQYLKVLESENGKRSSIFGSKTSTEQLQEKLQEINNTDKSSDPNDNSSKSVVDRELYDLLRVPVHASNIEIKKAYYTAAREAHPDRNINDPKAHEKFQRIGEAYQILSDANLRAVYDAKGKESMANNKMMDSSMLFALLFGSENFESILGELSLHAQMKAHTSEGSAEASSDALAFIQRRREVNLALTLSRRLDSYQLDGKDVFIEKVVEEVSTLVETPLGGSLLGVIGSVYLDCAHCEQSSLQNVGISFKRSLQGLNDTFSSIGSLMSTVKHSMKIKSIHAANSSGKTSESENQNPDAKLLDMLRLGPNATEEECKQLEMATKSCGSSLLRLLWNIIKSDVIMTLRNVCKKALRDHSVDQECRIKRVEALLLLGSQYLSKSISVSEGLDNLLEKLGKQTGLFANASKDSESEPTPIDSTDEKQQTMNIQELFHSIPNLSVKQLTTTIQQFNGSFDDCIEKEDLQNRLKYLLLLQMTKEDLYILASSIDDLPTSLSHQELVNYIMSKQ